MQAEDWLDAVLREAPRRFGMPALPADEHEAAALGPAAAIAWAMEHARRALADGTGPPPASGALFVRALAALMETALQPDTGDAGFQARVLQAQSAAVQEHVSLAATATADRRRARAAAQAAAHPGRPRRQDDLALGEALDRLARADVLAGHADVQRLQALRKRQAPAAGAGASAARGLAAEQAALRAFTALATRMNQPEPMPRWRVLDRLLVPAGFPGEAARSKSEWDIALLHDGAGDASDAGDALVLLAEVKAAPEAAVADLPRLLRGLHRLAQAHADEAYTFPCRAGTVRLQGASLQRLRPTGHALPPRVLYVSDAPTDRQPPWLDAAAQGVLLAQPEVVTLALQRLHDGQAGNAPLYALWNAMLHEGRLRGVLHQYETARTVREHLLHPADLLAAAGA